MTVAQKKAKTTRTRKAAPRKTKGQKPKARTPLILTKPEAPKVNGASSQLVVTGHEAVVAQLRAQQKQVDELTEEINAAKAELRAKVGKRRLREEIKGNFHKTVVLPSADGEDAKMVFQNRFNKIDVKHQDALKSGLNGHFNMLVTRKFDLKVKSDATLGALKAALGDKFEVMLGFVDVTEHLAMSGQFMETRANIRAILTDDENAACDAITDQMQFDPQVRLK